MELTTEVQRREEKIVTAASDRVGEKEEEAARNRGNVRAL
jgi:hypothetical protein